MEIIAIIIVVALSHSDYLPVAYAGLAIWVIANIIFLIYYCKVIRNDPTIMSVV